MLHAVCQVIHVHGMPFRQCVARVRFAILLLTCQLLVIFTVDVCLFWCTLSKEQHMEGHDRAGGSYIQAQPLSDPGCLVAKPEQTLVLVGNAVCTDGVEDGRSQAADVGARAHKQKQHCEQRCYIEQRRLKRITNTERVSL